MRKITNVINIEDHVFTTTAAEAALKADGEEAEVCKMILFCADDFTTTDPYVAEHIGKFTPVYQVNAVFIEDPMAWKKALAQFDTLDPDYQEIVSIRCDVEIYAKEHDLKRPRSRKRKQG